MAAFRPSARHPPHSQQSLLHSKHHLHTSNACSPTRLALFVLLLCVASLITVVCFRVLHIYAFGVGSANKGLRSRAEMNQRRYLYWGHGIDCPGKHCSDCGGLGHQESSLRCALEEALVLNRTFVLPSRVCIIAKHNDKGLLSSNLNRGKNESWAQSSCSLEALYDLELISRKVRVILDSSSEWQKALISCVQEENAVAHVEGVKCKELQDETYYRNAVVIKRKASSLAWFVECKDRHNRSAVLLPYSFLPTTSAKPLQMAAKKIRAALGDYDAIHVRRGDVLKIRKDRFGQARTRFPHLDRDTQAAAIMHRITDWIPAGRTLFIASNERRSDYFDPLFHKYNVFRSSNFTGILTGVVQNNYQLFMIERLILAGSKTLVKTFPELPTDLSLTDDQKSGNYRWEKPVHTFNDTMPT